MQTAVLLILFGLATFSIQNKAPTFDEQSYITRGLGYLRGENFHMRVGHPLGLNGLSAALLVNDPTVQLPTDDPSWQLTSFHRPSELFMWEIGNDVRKVIFLARLPTIWLTMLLAAVVARWARELTGQRKTAVFALILIALDPNILANGRLATTDLGLAFGATLAGWLLWRFFKRPCWINIILAALGFAVLQNTKFTAGLFVPLFTLVIVAGFIMLWRTSENKQDVWSALGMLMVAYPLVSFVALWGMYGFQISTMPDSLPTMPQLSGVTLPLARHLEQLLDIGGRLTKTTPSYLLGNYSDSGWWVYFPVAFVLKTPLPTLILLVWAFVLFGLRLVRQEETAVSLFNQIALLIPPLGYFAIALTTDINLGYRHLLPVLPFFAVWTAGQFTIYGRSVAVRHLRFTIGRFTKSAVNKLPNPQSPISQLPNYPITQLPNTPIHQYTNTPITNYQLPITLSWLLLITLLTFPHYLTFFNVFAGGADNGWRALVDSNLDWGQDLPLLESWMEENDVSWVWLSYFGEARPEYYGIEYRGLDSFPPRLMLPDIRPYNPINPAPGIYAISATTRQGVHFANHQQFDWFWDKEPIDKLGNSIFIYEVEPFGEPVELILDEIQLDELSADDLNALNSNQLRLHWLYDGASRYYPEQMENAWLATRRIGDWGLEIGDFEIVAERDEYVLLRLESMPQFKDGVSNVWEYDDGLIFMDVVIERVDVGETAVSLHLQTRLRHNGAPENIRQFIHITDSDNNIVAQWDGLDTAWQGWQRGDTLVQEQTIVLSADLNTDTLQIWTGIYYPETAVRWQLKDGGDRWKIVNCQLSIVNCQLSSPTTQLPNHQLPNHQLPNHQLPNYPITQLPNTPIHQYTNIPPLRGTS